MKGELTDLEQMKSAMGGLSKEDTQVSVENLILSIFAAADKAERTDETISKKHALDFKRSADFIAVLSCFGELSEEWKNRQKYSKYKAATILKALKKGEQPERGNPFEPEPQPSQDPMS